MSIFDFLNQKQPVVTKTSNKVTVKLNDGESASIEVFNVRVRGENIQAMDTRNCNTQAKLNVDNEDFNDAVEALSKKVRRKLGLDTGYDTLVKSLSEHVYKLTQDLEDAQTVIGNIGQTFGALGNVLDDYDYFKKAGSAKPSLLKAFVDSGFDLVAVARLVHRITILTETEFQKDVFRRLCEQHQGDLKVVAEQLRAEIFKDLEKRLVNGFEYSQKEAIEVVRVEYEAVLRNMVMAQRVADKKSADAANAGKAEVDAFVKKFADLASNLAPQAGLLKLLATDALKDNGRHELQVAAEVSTAEQEAVALKNLVVLFEAINKKANELTKSGTFTTYHAAHKQTRELLSATGHEMNDQFNKLLDDSKTFAKSQMDPMKILTSWGLYRSWDSKREVYVGLNPKKSSACYRDEAIANGSAESFYEKNRLNKEPSLFKTAKDALKNCMSDDATAVRKTEPVAGQ